jgi:hypothetical protein
LVRILQFNSLGLSRTGAVSRWESTGEARPGGVRDRALLSPLEFSPGGCRRSTNNTMPKTETIRLKRIAFKAE